eukprot:2946067-Pleurochrysis_carterae.AAC.1
MYRYDEDVVQPESGKQAYYDPEAAAAQRARWLANERAAAARDVEQEYADEMFPEPPPWHPDDLESDPMSTPTPERYPYTSSSPGDVSATPTQPANAPDLPSSVDSACETADDKPDAPAPVATPGSVHTWPVVSLVTNV